MNRIDDITIERYLDGTMSAAEQAQFQAKMAGDPALRRRVASEQSMIRALHADREAAPRNHSLVRSRVLASISQIAPASGAPHTESPKSRGRGRWPIVGAAMIVAAWIVMDIVVAPHNTSERAGSTTTSANSSTPQPVRDANVSASPTSQIDAAPATTQSQTKPTPDNAPSTRAVVTPRASARATTTSSSTDDAAVDAASATKKPLARRTDSVAKTSVEIGK